MNKRNHWLTIMALAALTVALGAIRTLAQEPPAKEADLIAILKSDAPKADKAITCKKLAVWGSEQAVPALAPLLADPELASWARIALEAIPGEAANQALRESLAQLKGRLLIGAINSLGVRRDAQALDALAAKLADADPEVAAAAAVALGRIGGTNAIKTLQPALSTTTGKVRDAVAEGLLLAADRLLAEGNATAAREIYDAVRSADVAKQRQVEAIRGAILSRGPQGVALLAEQLGSADRDVFAIALATARELATDEVAQALVNALGPIQKTTESTPPALTIKSARYGAGNQFVDVTQVLAAAVRNNSLRIQATNNLAGDPAPQVVKQLEVVYSIGGKEGKLVVKENDWVNLGQAVPPVDSRKVAILQALADIKRPAGVAALVEAARRGDWGLRLEAVRLLGQAGDASAVPVLVAAAGEGGELAAAAAEALIQLSGSDVDAAIVQQLQQAQGPGRAVLLQTAGQRLIAQALPIVLADMKSSDAAIRLAAIEAAGNLVPLEQLNVLIARLLQPENEAEAAAVKSALLNACSRMPNLDAAAAQLMSAWNQATPSARLTIVEVLGAMGGSGALASLGQIAKTGSDAEQDAATRALGEWMSPDAAPVLLDLAKSGNPRYRIRALRGFIRIARQLNVPLAERIQMCAQALEVADRAEEKRLVLEVLRRYPTADGLPLAASLLSVAELKAEAAETAVEIAEKLPPENASAVSQAMQRVVQAGVTGEVLQRAQKLLQRGQR